MGRLNEFIFKNWNWSTEENTESVWSYKSKKNWTQRPLQDPPVMVTVLTGTLWDISMNLSLKCGIEAPWKTENVSGITNRQHYCGSSK